MGPKVEAGAQTEIEDLGKTIAEGRQRGNATETGTGVVTTDLWRSNSTLAISRTRQFSQSYMIISSENMAETTF